MRSSTVILTTIATCLFSMAVTLWNPVIFAQSPVIADSQHAIQQSTNSNSSQTDSDRLIVQLAQILGPTGFMGWFCWFTMTRTLPKKDEQQVIQQDKFEAALKLQREQHAVELKEEREQHAANIEKILNEQRTANDRMFALLDKREETLLSVMQKCPGMKEC